MNNRFVSRHEKISFHEFPVRGVDAMSANSARAFPRHIHDQFGIGVIDRGGHASISDQGPIEAGAGSLIFVNPGEVHDGRPIRKHLRSWRMLYLEPALLVLLRSDVTDGTAKQLTFASPVMNDSSLRRSFDRLFAFSASNLPATSMACETALLHLAARVSVNEVASVCRVSRHSASIRKVRNRIDADPAAPVSLSELAREAGLSRYQLIRAFARQLGLTPHQYIVQQRIALARRLMRTGKAMAEVALCAGFCDQSHLHRNFVRQYGVAPSAYNARC